MTKEERFKNLSHSSFFILKSIKDLLDSLIDYEYYKISPEYFYYFIVRMMDLFYKFNFDNESQIYLYSHTERNLYGRYTEKIGNTKRRPYIFDKVKEVLIDKNIIYQSGYSQKEHKSRRYGLTNFTLQKINNKNFEIYEYKLEKTKLKKEKNSIPDEYDLLLQYNLLCSNRFTIDKEKAIDIIIQNKELTNIQKKFNILNILNIYNKEIFVKRGKNNNRIISSFTNLKSEIRQFCYIDGMPLQSLDLQSSQINLFVHFIKNKYPNNKEVDIFYNLVTSSDIYLYVINKANELNLNNYKIWNNKNFDWDYIKIEDRKDAKKEMFKFIYSKINKKNIFSEILQKEFPELFKIIIEEKKTRRQNHTINLAVELQRLESNIFLPVANKFINKGALTVHDSIYFKKELYSDILRELEESFKRNNIYKFILK